MFDRRFSTLLLVLFSTALLTGCSGDAADAPQNGTTATVTRPAPVDIAEAKPENLVDGKPMPGLDAPIAERYTWAARAQHMEAVRAKKGEIRVLEKSIAAAEAAGERVSRIEQRRKGRLEKDLQKLLDVPDSELPAPNLSYRFEIGSIGHVPGMKAEISEIEGDDLILAQVTFVVIGRSMTITNVRREVSRSLWLGGVDTNGLTKGESIELPQLYSVVGMHPFTNSSDITTELPLAVQVAYDAAGDTSDEEAPSEDASADDVASEATDTPAADEPDPAEVATTGDTEEPEPAEVATTEDSTEADTEEPEPEEPATTDEAEDKEEPTEESADESTEEPPAETGDESDADEASESD